MRAEVRIAPPASWSSTKRENGRIAALVASTGRSVSTNASAPFGKTRASAAMVRSGVTGTPSEPVGASARTFRAIADRMGSALGVTVSDADAAYRTIAALSGCTIEVSGPPKEHPWGEKSFLLTDPDGNRWEIAQSPSPGGMLEDR